MSDWKWVLHDASGRDMRSTESFPSGEAAEEWMGDHWEALSDEGAESVSLDGDGERHYTMSLLSE